MAGFPQLSYTSVRYVKIANTRLALIYYGLLILLLIYVVVVSIVIDKGYLAYDTLSGVNSIKVKGVAHCTGINNESNHVYDSYDLIQPPTEVDALFITTTFAQTKQTRGVCEGNSRSPEFDTPTRENCTTSMDCPPGTYTFNGIMNGTCGPTGFCFLDAWCPVENDDDLDKQQKIVFPKFGLHAHNGDTLQKGVNQFFPGEMLETVDVSYNEVKKDGAVLLVAMKYDCDCGMECDDADSNCSPDVEIARIDTQSKLKTFKPGFNYRYITLGKNSENVEERTLTKVWGLRILFQMTGSAGKFSLTALTTTFGAGVALLSISKLICDFLLQYLYPGRERFVKQKFNDISINSPSSDALLGSQREI